MVIFQTQVACVDLCPFSKAIMCSLGACLKEGLGTIWEKVTVFRHALLVVSL